MRNLCFNCPYNKGLELGNGCGNDTCIQENMLFEKDEEPVEIEKLNQQNLKLIKENQQLKQRLADKEKYTYTGEEVGKIEQNYDNQLAIIEKALELAVKDKCKFENALLSTSLGIAGGKVAVPKKEQYYIEQAKEMLGNEQ